MEMVILKLVYLMQNLPPIEAVKLADDSLGATVKSLCAMLGITRVGQTARIKRNPALARGLVLMTFATPGGPQLVDVILSWAIPVWLSGLNITRLSPSKRDTALILQQGAIAAIEAAFSSTESELDKASPAQSALIPSDAFATMQEGLQATMAGIGQLQAGLASLQQSHATILARLAALESMPRQQSGSGLPPEKIAHIFVLVRSLRAKRGVPIEETLQALASHFGGGHFSDIPAAAWPDVLTWLNALSSQEN